VVLVFPPFGVSTPAAFRWFDEDGAALVSPRGFLPMGAGRLPVFNDLEAPVERRHPDIAAIRQALDDAGATVAAMTGSGSTVFGLFDAIGTAEQAAATLSRAGWRTLVTSTRPRDHAA